MPKQTAPDPIPLPGEIDMTSLLEYLSSIHQTQLAQLRTINNNLAKLLTTDIALEEDIRAMMRILDHSRESRINEEIDLLENQVVILTSQLEGKKNAKVDLKTTSERIRSVTKEEIANQTAAIQAKTQINWQAVRQTVVQAVAGSLAIGLILGLIGIAPQIGEALKVIFGR